MERKAAMVIGRWILGVLLFLAGAVWCLQGLRVLPGSFMTGSTFWAVAGVVVAVLGLAVLPLRPRARRG